MSNFLYEIPWMWTFYYFGCYCLLLNYYKYLFLMKRYFLRLIAQSPNIQLFTLKAYRHLFIHTYDALRFSKYSKWHALPAPLVITNMPKINFSDSQSLSNVSLISSDVDTDLCQWFCWHSHTPHKHFASCLTSDQWRIGFSSQMHRGPLFLLTVIFDF